MTADGSRFKLTAGRVREFHVREGQSQSFLWDADIPWLAVRATAGAKTFIFQSRVAKQTIRVKIGSVEAWGIDAARAEARRLQTLIDQGIDPRQDRAEKLEAAAERQRAVEAKEAEQGRRAAIVADAWVRYLKARQPRWGEHHYQDHLKAARGPLAPLMTLRLVDLTPQRLQEWLEAEAATRPAFAALSYRLLKAFLNWCQTQTATSGLADPAALRTTAVREAVPSTQARSDCLQREQLAVWFEAVRQMSNPVISAYLQGLLLTGARREELAALTWDNLDFRWRSITIRDKMEGERTIPLPPYLASLLATLPHRNAWVFSSPTAASGRLAEPRIAHNRALQVAGLPPLSLHGLRRSFGTLSEWVEMPTGVVAQIMGHKPSATAEKHYRVRPLDLLRQWHTKLEAWILDQAGIAFVEQEQAGLRRVK